METPEKYLPIKRKMYEFMEFGSDIRYSKSDEPDKLLSGGYIIGNHEGKDNVRYFIVRNRTNVNSFYILRYDQIHKLYRKKTLFDIVMQEMVKKN